MKSFFLFTAWEMQTPKAYGPFHIITTLILLSIAIGLTYLLRNTDDKKNKRVLLIVGLFLMTTEIYKILFYYYVKPDYNLWWIFPYQLCSVPMYLCVISFFIKNKKVNNWIYAFMGIVNFLGGLMAFLEPSGIHHEYLTLTLHAYIWHMTLVFIGMYLFVTNRSITNLYGYIKGMVVFFMAAGLAQLLNVVFRKIEGFNLFYISPFTRSPLAVFKDFYVSVGWFWTMILYFLAIAIASAIIYYGLYAVKKLLNKKSKQNSI